MACHKCRTPLEGKVVTGGVVGAKKDTISHFSSAVKSMVASVTPLKGAAKAKSGHHFTSLKQCHTCTKDLPVGSMRYSCKRCQFHLCADCAGFGEDGRTMCRYGLNCYNHSPEHLERYSHGVSLHSTNSEVVHKWRACRYGQECMRKDPSHLGQFAHPGDVNYRLGRVIIEPGRFPEFGTQRQLFNYYDPDESGNLSKDEFSQALETCKRLSGKKDLALADSWTAAGCEAHGYMNFTQFTEFADSIGIEVPVGLDLSSSVRPCRFRFSGTGGSCSCDSFTPVSPGSMFCECGHKDSMHRSEAAECTTRNLFASLTNETWNSQDDILLEGLVDVTDAAMLGQLQKLLTATHKTTDNWTRDRGCVKHGVNKCSVDCCKRNKCPVPRSYSLVHAYRNQNMGLWGKYLLKRTAIAEECERSCMGSEFKEVRVKSQVDLDSPLQANCNEWRLFHGSGIDACNGICSSNFRVALAGTGATWKDSGKGKGTPLYGFGIYLAEQITKADEYAKPFTSDEGTELYAALLCRVTGGRANVVTTNEIDTEKLRTDIFDGPYHAVVGDRVSSLGKPFREVVVHDKDQIYPEFVLMYKRNF